MKVMKSMTNIVIEMVDIIIFNRLIYIVGIN